jgi:hypothetical protein
MNDLRRPLTQGGPGRPPENLDGLLRRFFRSEMPQPWPAAPKVQAPAEREHPPRPWFRHTSRLALAAAMVLFLIGYLALAGKFPVGNVREAPSIRPEISHKQRPGQLPPPLLPLEPQTRRLSDGGEAKSWGVRTGPKGTIYLNVERTK